MKKVKVKELSLAGFQVYGSFANLINPAAYHFGAEPIEFFRDLLPLELGGAGSASFSVCRVTRRPLIVDVTEYHSGCGEGLLPLDGDVLIHVGPATPPGPPPLGDFEVFRVPRGAMVCLRPGVWHHAPFALQGPAANVLIALPERTYAQDCVVYEIPERERIGIALK